MRRVRLVLAAALGSWLLWACANATVAGDFRAPEALARQEGDARAWAADIREIRATHVGAWSCMVENPSSCGDTSSAAEVITRLYTDDAVFEDAMFGDLARGTAELSALFVRRLSEGRVLVSEPAVASFVGRDRAALVEKTRNVFGPAELRVLGVYDLRGRLISNVALYYPVASRRAHLYFSAPDADAARSLSEKYVTAWSSGDPQVVAALYSPDAIVVDALLDRTATGSEQLEASAARLFAAFPDVSFSPGMAYVFSPVSEAMASEYSIGYSQGAETCKVRALSMFDVSAGLIGQETIFYDAETLSCINY